MCSVAWALEGRPHAECRARPTTQTREFRCGFCPMSVIGPGASGFRVEVSVKARVSLKPFPPRRNLEIQGLCLGYRVTVRIALKPFSPCRSQCFLGLKG